MTPAFYVSLAAVTVTFVGGLLRISWQLSHLSTVVETLQYEVERLREKTDRA